MPLSDPLSLEQAAATQYKMLEREYEMFSSENKMILAQEVSLIRDMSTFSLALLAASLTALQLHLSTDIWIYASTLMSGLALHFSYLTRLELIGQAMQRETFLKGRHLDILLLGDELAEMKPQQHSKLTEYRLKHPLEFPKSGWLREYGRPTAWILIWTSFICLAAAVFTSKF
ncbi:hypothetical protein [Streptomyces sp. PTY087I2]|uniref:hypothetical protein n=1 Tax=Streptomyces sp. PTY087I2 TaxID=1819298 RepID=UPI00114C959E|nr:hypothetical protein [Streptomyces sp. PTY087I2]